MGVSGFLVYLHLIVRTNRTTHLHGQVGNCFTVRQVNYTLKMLQEKIIINQMLTTRPLTPYRLLATTELYDLDHTHTAHMQNLSLSKTGISFSAIILLRGILMHTPQHTYTGVFYFYTHIRKFHFISYLTRNESLQSLQMITDHSSPIASMPI